MTDIRLDLSDSDNWEEVYFGSKTVEKLGPSSYKPMGEFEIPILLDRSILAAFTESATSPPHWKRAGWLAQKINLGIVTGGQPDANTSNIRRCRLKRIVLIQWPNLVDSYALTFFPHYWLEDVSIRIWKYTGPEVSLLAEQIDLARVDILRTERKVNALIDRG